MILTERYRLIDLLIKAGVTWNPCGKADCLLENGVIVPPVKVGQTIYRCGDPIKKVYGWNIALIEIYEDELIFIDDSNNTFIEKDIGKTVFLTRKEAEQALKERCENNE